LIELLRDKCGTCRNVDSNFGVVEKCKFDNIQPGEKKLIKENSTSRNLGLPSVTFFTINLSFGGLRINN
jgi:hypothetical protein